MQDSSISGLYSRKAFEKVGFDVNAEYLYSDYKDEESGKQIFESITEPHRCVTLMTKQLNDEKGQEEKRKKKKNNDEN